MMLWEVLGDISSNEAILGQTKARCLQQVAHL